MSSPQPSPSKPLASRDVNTSSPTKSKDPKPLTGEEGINKLKSMEYHRQVLQSRLEEDKSNQKYVSPSDTIMSPCTAKLNAYKSKQFMKSKPQSLFGKMETTKRSAVGTPLSEEGKKSQEGGP